MSGMLWIALELSIPKIGFNIMLSLMVIELIAIKIYEIAECGNTDFSNRVLACLHCCTKSPQIFNLSLRFSLKGKAQGPRVNDHLDQD